MQSIVRRHLQVTEFATRGIRVAIVVLVTGVPILSAAERPSAQDEHTDSRFGLAVSNRGDSHPDDKNPELENRDDEGASIQQVQNVEDATPVRPPDSSRLATPPGSSPRSRPAPSAQTFRSPRRLLARVPNMFGDFLPFSAVATTGATLAGSTEIPLAGGSRRAKVSENNKALPMDRVFFLYNHFHNAVEGDLDINSAGGLVRSSIDRYTVGFEKTFCCGNSSVELRAPFHSDYTFANPADFTTAGGEIGNLAIFFKKLIWMNKNSALATGLGVDLPTGSDVEGQLGNLTSYRIENDAVHLSPFVAVLVAPDECWFLNSFVQLDVALNGNDVVIEGLGATSAVLTEQNLLHANASLGRWLYRNPCSSGITGLAALFELHYLTTVQDADQIINLHTDLDFLGNRLNRIDQLNASIAFHAQLGPCTTLRVGAVIPLADEEEEPFDAEVAVQVNRRF